MAKGRSGGRRSGLTILVDDKSRNLIYVSDGNVYKNSSSVRNKLGAKSDASTLRVVKTGSNTYEVSSKNLGIIDPSNDVAVSSRILNYFNNNPVAGYNFVDVNQQNSINMNAQPSGTVSAPKPNAQGIQPMTDAYAKSLRNAKDGNYDPDVTDAIKNYISNNNPNGDGYSHSQNLNHKLDTHGGNASTANLNPTEQYIYDNIRYGMHDIGIKTTLERYDHDKVIRAFGINDYTKMSESQLRQKLVGGTFSSTSFMSTSYDANKNPFSPGQPGGNGREVTLKITTKPDTKMVFGAKNQAEVILDQGTNLRITNVYYDGSTAYPRNGSSRPRVVLEVECY